MFFSEGIIIRLLDRILKKSAVPGLLGLEIRPTGTAVAHVNGYVGDRPIVQSCRFLTAENDAAPPLAEYIEEMGLRGAKCNVVLPTDNYSLIITEAPEVEDSELASAMRWTIQDLIEFPIEDAVLDVFRLPDDVSRGNTRMVYVAVSRRSLIEEIISELDASGLELGTIDIMELALRNISLSLKADDEGNEERVEESHGLAIVNLSKGTGNLNIVKDRQLYLSRRFDIEWEGDLLEPLPANALALELQRSLDYYERQMNQVPPSKIYLCGQGVSHEKVSPEMKVSLGGELTVLPLAELLVLPEGADEFALTNCIGAMGGALREVSMK